MDDDFYEVRGDSFKVERVTGIPRTHNNEHAEQDGKKRHHHPDQHEKRHPKEYFHTITRAAKTSNELLEKKGSPYRFCVYDNDGKVMIDLVTLDDAGKIIKEVKRNITDEDFDRLIENISSIEGLIFDSTG